MIDVVKPSWYGIQEGSHVVTIIDWDESKKKSLEWYDMELAFPVRGTVYTVREIEKNTDGVGIRLQEIINPEVNTRIGVMEPAFNILRFRPLKKITVEDFAETKILIPA